MNSYSCCFSSTYVTTYPSFLCGPPSSSSSSSITNLRRPGCGDRGVDRTTSCVLGVSCSPFDGSSQNPRLLLIFPNGAKEKRLAKPNFFFFHERYPLLQHRIFKGQPQWPHPPSPDVTPPLPGLVEKRNLSFVWRLPYQQTTTTTTTSRFHPKTPPKKNRILIIQPSRKEKKNPPFFRALGGGKIQE